MARSAGGARGGCRGEGGEGAAPGAAGAAPGVRQHPTKRAGPMGDLGVTGLFSSVAPREVKLSGLKRIRWPRALTGMNSATRPQSSARSLSPENPSTLGRITDHLRRHLRTCRAYPLRASKCPHAHPFCRAHPLVLRPYEVRFQGSECVACLAAPFPRQPSLRGQRFGCSRLSPNLRIIAMDPRVRNSDTAWHAILWYNIQSDTTYFLACC